MADQNNSGTPDDNTPEDSDGSPKKYASWEDVPAKIREKIDQRLAEYQPDGLFPARGMLDLSDCGLNARVAAICFGEHLPRLKNVTWLNLTKNAMGEIKGVGSL